jgi:hypothetical protein
VCVVGDDSTHTNYHNFMKYLTTIRIETSISTTGVSLDRDTYVVHVEEEEMTEGGNEQTVDRICIEVDLDN